jgi:hypothetical protein
MRARSVEEPSTAARLLPMTVLDKGDSPCLSKLFIHGEKGCIRLSQGGPKIKYLFQEGMPRKGSSHWLDIRGLSRYLISTESSGLEVKVTNCHGPPSGVSWLHAPGQKSGWLPVNSCRSQFRVLSEF